MPFELLDAQPTIPDFDLNQWTYDWKKCSIKENNDPLIDLCDQHDRIHYTPVYYHQNISGAITKCYVRQALLPLLLRVIDQLPDRYSISIFDAWRPLSVQQSLFDEFKQKIKHENPNLSNNDYLKLTQKFVSLPSDNPLSPSPHYTGGSIDLTILDASGIPLDMGTAFDDFTDYAHTAAFEKVNHDVPINNTIRNNRRLLYTLMTNVGFTNYPYEWWHFDYGNQFWATMKGESACLYGPAIP